MKFIQQEMMATISNMQEDTLTQSQEKINKLFEMAKLAQCIWGKVPNFEISKENNNPVSNFIDDIALNDIPKTFQQSESHPYIIIDSLDDLPSSSVSPELPKENDESTETMELPLEPVLTVSEEQKSYPLERRLRGGLLKVMNETIYVPEKAIRQQEFQHGDYLTITPLDDKNNTFTKVKDSTTAHECDRVEVDYCIISKSPDGFLISNKHLVNGQLRTIMHNNETPLSFLMSEDDQQKFNLKEGMFVTIAYSKNNPLRKRVCWAYSDETQPHVTPKPTSYYKDTKVEKAPIWSDEERTILQGKKVVLLGGNVKKSEVDTIAKAGNFEIEILTGYENTQRIENSLQSANLILSATAHLSHRSTELAKQFAKERKITHRIIQSSLCSIKKGLLHGFKNKEQLLVSLF